MAPLLQFNVFYKLLFAVFMNYRKTEITFAFEEICFISATNNNKKISSTIEQWVW